MLCRWGSTVCMIVSTMIQYPNTNTYYIIPYLIRNFKVKYRKKFELSQLIREKASRIVDPGC